MLYYDKLTKDVVDDPNKIVIDEKAMTYLIEKYKDKLDKKEINNVKFAQALEVIIIALFNSKYNK